MPESVPGALHQTCFANDFLHRRIDIDVGIARQHIIAGLAPDLIVTIAAIQHIGTTEVADDLVPAADGIAVYADIGGVTQYHTRQLGIAGSKIIG